MRDVIYNDQWNRTARERLIRQIEELQILENQLKDLSLRTDPSRRAPVEETVADIGRLRRNLTRNKEILEMREEDTRRCIRRISDMLQESREMAERVFS